MNWFKVTMFSLTSYGNRKFKGTQIQDSQFTNHFCLSLELNCFRLTQNLISSVKGDLTFNFSITEV